MLKCDCCGSTCIDGQEGKLLVPVADWERLNAELVKAKLAQRADSGAEVNEVDAKVFASAFVEAGGKGLTDCLDYRFTRAALDAVLAARRGAAQQPSFALTAKEKAAFEMSALDAGASEYESLRFALERAREALAATPAPEQQPAARWTEADYSAAREAHRLARRGSFADGVEAALDAVAYRLPAPAAIEPLSAIDLAVRDQAHQLLYGELKPLSMAQGMFLLDVVDRLAPRPAAPAVKAESVEEIVQLIMDDSWQVGPDVEDYANRLRAACAREKSNG